MSATLEKSLGLAKTQTGNKIYVTHLTVRQSITILVIKLILVDLVTAVIFLFFHSMLFNTNIPENLGISQNYYNTVIFLILVFGKILLTLFLTLEWINEYYEIIPDAVIHKRGIIFRKIKKQDLVLIRLIKIEHGLLGRILNYGTISLYDIRLHKEIKLYLIHNPLKYITIFKEIIPDLEEEKSFFLREKRLEDPIAE